MDKEANIEIFKENETLNFLRNSRSISIPEKPDLEVELDEVNVDKHTSSIEMKEEFKFSNNKSAELRLSSGGYPLQWPASYRSNVHFPSPSLNLYQQKKTIAQGMLDLALLSSNTNQLRYILDIEERNHYYYISLIGISLSLVLQILVAIALVFKSQYNIDNRLEYENADRVNNFITMGILLITIINVFTSAFGVTPTEQGKI